MSNLNQFIMVSNTLSMVSNTVGGQTIATEFDTIALTNASTTSYVTLPASPTIGAWVKIINATANVTHYINPNGGNILGNSSNFVLDMANSAVTVAYISAAIGWWVI